MWCVERFGISHYLAFAWPFERMRVHANAFFYRMWFLYVCMSVSMAFKRVYQMSNVKMPFKRVNTSNLMTFECCFLISQYHENCNAMLSFTVLCHVPWNIFICNAVQCFHQFVMIFIYCLISFLVMQKITNTVILLKFQQNVQFLCVIFKKAFQDHCNYEYFLKEQKDVVKI